MSGTSYKEKYDTNLKSLMDLIPTAGAISKQVDELGFKQKSIRWVVDDRVVYSLSRGVYSIDHNLDETRLFVMKLKDYKKFATECDKRRNELLGTSQQNAKK
ncbi:MAG: hypothetical protein J6T57_00445 [Alphaproteobacteria bacterium]|nr:hypothetical protein [Alphaproteobacteria bacterium]